MKAKWILLTLTALVMMILSACGQASQPTVDNAAVGTIVALNIQLTQASATLTAVIGQESATTYPTLTPAETVTPTLEPSITGTLSGVWLTFDQNTNCRSGPATSYPNILLINAGEKVQAVARTENSQWYYVRYIDTSAHYCWVTQLTAYTSGDSDRLPAYTAVPTSTPTITPTPPAGFTVTYNSKTSCSPNYAINLFVKNTGYLTWQSIKVVVVDNTTGVTVMHTSDSFVGYSGCDIVQTQQDLTTYESGLVSVYNPGQFTYDPSGHSLSITVTLYSENGQSGTFVTQTLNATP